jgi:hypothetical protein
MGLPVTALALIVGCAALVPDVYEDLFRGELGIVELATPAVMLCGVVWAGRGLSVVPVRHRLPTRGWLLAFIIGAVYFAGEELSWGQQLFGWSTPEAWLAINDQGETNLHNVHGLLDQTPKMLLRYGAFLGGVLAPLVADILAPRVGGLAAHWSFWRWLWPTSACTPAALIILACFFVGRIDGGLLPWGIDWVIRVSEVEELFHAIFLTVYAGTLVTRLRLGEGAAAG